MRIDDQGISLCRAVEDVAVLFESPQPVALENLLAGKIALSAALAEITGSESSDELKPSLTDKTVIRLTD